MAFDVHSTKSGKSLTPVRAAPAAERCEYSLRTNHGEPRGLDSIKQGFAWKFTGLASYSSYTAATTYCLQFVSSPSMSTEYCLLGSMFIEDWWEKG